ncbi:uncharacterized protein [Macrobrachium rosenbergii]|uniref:uncharacterized protein n=1 Tax=Macrobrachium rosenbergii TaxID=79674 RepID=UPI0034D411D9
MKPEGRVCSICSQKYDSDHTPWRLSCGHTLCSACMDEILFEEEPCSKCLIQQPCVSSSSECPEKSLEQGAGDSKFGVKEDVKDTTDLSSVTSGISEESEYRDLNISSPDASSKELPVDEESFQVYPPTLDTEDKRESCRLHDGTEATQSTSDRSTDLSDADETLHSLGETEVTPDGCCLTDAFREAQPCSALSESKTPGENDSADDWKQKDVKLIDEKIVMLREIQSQMTELMNQRPVSQVHGAPISLSNVPERELEAKGKIQEISDLVSSLENLKMEVQFAKLSSIVSDAKKEVSQVQSTIRQRIEDEMEKKDSRRPGPDILGQGEPGNALNRMTNERLVKYTPVIVEDSVISNGESTDAPMQSLCLAEEDERDGKSFEELRFEHYSDCRYAIREGPSPSYKSPLGFSFNFQKKKLGNYESDKWLNVLQHDEPPESASESYKPESEPFPSNSSSGTSHAKYTPVAHVEYEGRLQVITAMKEYADKSLEELRVERYISDGVALGLDSFLINRTFKGVATKGRRPRQRLSRQDSSPQTLVVPNSLKSSVFPKYKPAKGFDFLIENGAKHIVGVHFQVISLMKAYKDKSFEEIRVEQQMNVS